MMKFDEFPKNTPRDLELQNLYTARAAGYRGMPTKSRFTGAGLCTNAFKRAPSTAAAVTC
jgi:hypothetical protein